MKGLKTTKRLIAAVLSLVMMLGMLPVIPLSINAAGTSEDVNYVSLPITIRDFAADGMLFESNELGDTGTMGSGGPTVVFQEANVGAGSKVDNGGYVRYTDASYKGAGMYVTCYLDSGSYTRDDVRYAVIRYRTYSAPYNNYTPQISQRKDSTYYNYVNLDTSTYNNGWQIVVLDLGGGTSQVNYVTLYPRLSSDKYIDIDYIAFFDNSADAQWAKTNNDVTTKSLYHHGNNLGFGMLATTGASHINNLFEDMSTDGLIVNKDGIPGTTYYRNGKWGSVYKEPCNITLNSGIQQTLYGGVIRTDLVSAELVDKRPVYTEAAVTYLANYMSQVMQEPWQNSDGSYNMWHVVGQKLEELNNQDLASHLRAQIKANNNAMGTYAEAKAAYGTEALDGYEDIDTYFEAAYFLLHGTFDDNVGYGQTISAYKELRLVEKTGDDGKTYYVFNSGYNASKYDPVNGVIINTQTDAADYHQGKASNKDALRGNAWYTNRFDPLNPSLFNGLTYEGYPIAGDTYRDISGMTNADQEEAEYYETTNYHLSLEGHAQFVYHYEDELYFTFTGDDDVYLYINGVRVLDLGGAHSISKVRIDLNDPTIVEKCNLEEGEAYDFDFFYMERHGSAANFSIETNIKIVNPSMVTTKKAYQDGQAIGYNGFVKDRNENDLIVYEFGLENKGEAHLNNLTFVDSDIDVTVGYDQISLNGFTTISDITATIYHTDGSTTVYESLDEATLKAVLTQGIAINEKIVLHGFNYNVPDADWVNNSFVNRVETSALAQYENSNTEKLTGVADWMVQKYDILFDSLHVYDWGRLKNGAFVEGSAAGVTLTKAELLSVAEDATDAFGNPLTTEDVPDYKYDVHGHASSTVHSDAQFGQETFNLMARGAYINLGKIDLSKYTAVVIRYGSDPNAKLGNVKSEFCLTSTGAVQDSNGNAKAATYLGRATLSNSTGFWGEVQRTVTIPLSTTYNGNVYLAMYMRDGNGTSISAMTFIGKDGVEFTISPNATIKLCSPSGGYTGGLNKNATLNADQSVTYKSTATGASVYHYNIIDNGVTYGPVSVNVFTYGVADTAYVLDYGLPVKIFGEESDFTADDVVDLGKANPYGTSFSLTNIGAKTNVYGDFTNTDDSITYTLNEKTFFNGTDTIELTLQVLETGTTEVTKTTGVTMTQTVTVVPANVMYYEDDFGSLNYINKGTDENGNIWVVYDSPDKMGYQSSDQSENYGYDSGYSMFLSKMLMFNPEFVKDADPDKLQAILDELFHGPKSDWDNEDNNPDDFANYIPYPGGVLYGDASNDSIHLLKVNSTTSEAVLSFEFVGTGFEILSRTTWNETYAVLTVRLDKKDENGEWKFDQAIPVISESIGGDLTQIPLVVMKDLAYGEYQVTVLASNYREQTRLFFVDGIRVYQPLTDEQEALYYKADEKNVTFTEIKTEISQGNIVYGTVSPNLTADEMVEYIQSWGFGDTMIENRGDDDLVLIGTSPKDKEEKQLTPYEQYMYYGPNNEIYLSTANGCALSYIAFYVTKDESYVGERSIQVGAHLKYTTDNPDAWDPNGMNFVSLMYGDTALNFADPSYRYSVGSGTEQYFSINLDFSKPCIENGVEKYLVIIGTDDANRNVLALTNIKLNGYTILGGGTAAAELTVLQDVSDINASHMAAETYGLIKRYVAKNN